VRVHSDDIEPVSQAMSQIILNALKNNSQSVTWLVSGGSCIPVAVRTRELLGEMDDLKRLSIVMMDERYGEIGHEASNSFQLKKAGFDLNGLVYHEILCDESVESTTERFVDMLERLRHTSDVIIGLFGMGEDGHTAGLLPKNPLMSMNVVAGYFVGPDYERITAAPAFLKSIDTAVLYAAGENKWPALAKLQQPGSLDELPVRLLRNIEDVKIYSDIEIGKE